MVVRHNILEATVGCVSLPIALLDRYKHTTVLSGLSTHWDLSRVSPLDFQAFQLSLGRLGDLHLVPVGNVERHWSSETLRSLSVFYSLCAATT